MSKLWKYFLPGYLLALPLTVFGLLMALYYRPGTMRMSDGCIEFVLPSGQYLIGGKWVGAQTYGNVIFYRDHDMQRYTPLRVHERCHTVQAMCLSLLLAVGYGLHYAYRRRKLGHYEAYRGIWFEHQAYAKQYSEGWGS